MLENCFQYDLPEAGCDEAGRGCLAGPTGRLLEALMKDTGCDCHWFWLQSGQTRINTKINTSPETAFNASGPAPGQTDIGALCGVRRRSYRAD